MHKLCSLIVLHFVIKIAHGDGDENSFQCICSDANGKFNTPAVGKNVVFGERVSTPSTEQKTLQRLDSLENSVKMIVEENAKIATLISSLNGIETLMRYAVDTINTYPQNCREATKLRHPSGFYGIQVEEYSSEPFKVYCEEDLFEGGWIVIARRMDGSVDFDRNWTDYKHGFGDLYGEFFIGMDKLYALTNGQKTQELIFVLGDFDDTRKYAKYSEFAIGDESEEYKIKTLGNYSGDAGDSFNVHRYRTFKTKDRDATSAKCTKYGAWWYSNCYSSNLFGSYLKESSSYGKGVVWYQWRGAYYSLKFVQMMIRPKST